LIIFTASTEAVFLSILTAFSSVILTERHQNTVMRHPSALPNSLKNKKLRRNRPFGTTVAKRMPRANARLTYQEAPKSPKQIWEIKQAQW